MLGVLGLGLSAAAATTHMCPVHVRFCHEHRLLLWKQHIQHSSVDQVWILFPHTSCTAAQQHGSTAAHQLHGGMQ
jgi:hypothetical protein